MKKPHAGSVLRMLPAEQQRELFEYLQTHSQVEAIGWLAAQGIKAGTSQLSRFWQWYPLAASQHATSSAAGVMTLFFSDGSKMTVKTAGNTNLGASGGTVKEVRQAGTDLLIEFEEHDPLALVTAESTSCVIPPACSLLLSPEPLLSKSPHMRIWDLHTHFPSTGGTAQQRAEKLLRAADRMGIERLCIYMGFPLTTDPAPERFRFENDQVLSVLPKWPDRLLGFVYLNPRHPDESLAELDRCVVQGPMVGVKLWVAQRTNTPEVDRIVQRARELDALVFQHTWFKAMGNPPGESTPIDFAEMARRHLDMPLVCGHTGGDWEKGIRTIASVKNAYADLAGSDPVAGYTEMAVRELGAERVLYGSDAGGRSFASQLAKVDGAEIPENAKRLIFAENLIRLLAPILRKKSISF